jgi:DNA-binding NarL/FixJ family response regulator
MRPIICFIDDSRFEQDLVQKEIASSAPELEFVQTYTFEEARDKLSTRAPALFLLDLWGKDEDVRHPHISPKEDLETKISSFPSLDDVYKDLDDFTGDVANEYLKRLFTIVDNWRRLFEEVCDRIGQNRKYGLWNLRQVRNNYPGVPAVFYTRKSLINDAVAMFRAGADSLFIKPTGSNDTETRRLTREYAPRLIEELKKIIDSKKSSHKTSSIFQNSV